MNWSDGAWTDAAGTFAPPLAAPDNFAGTYWMRVRRPGFIPLDSAAALPIAGSQNASPSLTPDPLLVERAWGADRYSTAVRVARGRFTTPAHPQGWWGVDTVVIASGEDRAAADPLAAAGLCGAYGETPLFLVSGAMVPSSVKQALSEISTTYGRPVRVVVVGGPVSVPNARLAEIEAAMPNGAIMDRLLNTGDRFDLAAAISGRINTIAGAPGLALVANGADPEKFFDPLALSTIAAGNALPILLVTEDSIPAPTRGALEQLIGNKDIIIGGGPASVSPGVMARLDLDFGDVERWAGGDRYTTAQVIANEAIANGMLRDDVVGVASKLPDALTGGATIGQSEGVLLITDGETLTPSTGSWLVTHKMAIDKAYIVGGPVSVTPGVMNSVAGLL
jgi:N-acetylmuramoyl-L-alanine amidase